MDNYTIEILQGFPSFLYFKSPRDPKGPRAKIKSS